MSEHTYYHHLCLFHNTYKCKFLIWTSNSTSTDILVSKKYKNVHFPYQLLWVYVAYENIILETLKTILHLAITGTNMNEFGSLSNSQKIIT